MKFEIQQVDFNDIFSAFGSTDNIISNVSMDIVRRHSTPLWQGTEYKYLLCKSFRI